MAATQQQRVIAGKYELVKPLSEGGMGSVWLAHHLDLDAPVAVKFMHSALAESSDARARFSREAKAAAQIRSPFVVHVYDYGIDDGTPYIVMEYLEGEDLSTRLTRERVLPIAEAVRICDQICKGLHFAHELGIIHRDLKPGNVFLCAKADDMVKLLDFGIAKETGERRLVPSAGTTTGQLLGSPHYLSPEQARGMGVDQRSDLWSVAVLLFRGLTGKRPFDSNDMGDLVVRICMDPIPKACSLRPELPEAIDQFFERALSRDVDARYPDARAFAKAFAAATQGASCPLEAPLASPDSLTATTPSGDPLQAREPPAAAPTDAPAWHGALATRLPTPALPSTGEDAAAAAELRGGTLDATSSASTTGRERRRRVRVVAAVIALGAAGVASAVGIGGLTETSSALQPTPTDEPQPTDSAAAAVASDGSSAVTASRDAKSAAEPTPDAGAPSAKSPAPAPPRSTATARRPARSSRPAPTSTPLPEIGY